MGTQEREDVAHAGNQGDLDTIFLHDLYQPGNNPAFRVGVVFQIAKEILPFVASILIAECVQ